MYMTKEKAIEKLTFIRQSMETIMPEIVKLELELKEKKELFYKLAQDQDICIENITDVRTEKTNSKSGIIVPESKKLII